MKKKMTLFKLSAEVKFSCPSLLDRKYTAGSFFLSIIFVWAQKPNENLALTGPNLSVRTG